MSYRVLTSAGTVTGSGVTATVLASLAETILPYYAFLPAGSVLAGQTAASTAHNLSAYMRWNIAGTVGVMGGGAADTIAWRLYRGAQPGVSGTAVTSAIVVTQPMDGVAASDWRLTCELQGWNSPATSSAGCRVAVFLKYIAGASNTTLTAAEQSYMSTANSDIIVNTADQYLWWTVAGVTTTASGTAVYWPKAIHASISAEPRSW